MALPNEKLCVVVSRNCKIALRAEARARGLTLSELVQRRLDGEATTGQGAVLDEISELGVKVRAVRDRLKHTLTELARADSDRNKREAKIRSEIRASLSRAEGEALARTLWK